MLLPKASSVAAIRDDQPIAGVLQKSIFALLNDFCWQTAEEILSSIEFDALNSEPEGYAPNEYILRVKLSQLSKRGLLISRPVRNRMAFFLKSNSSGQGRAFEYMLPAPQPVVIERIRSSQSQAFKRRFDARCALAVSLSP